MKLERAFEDDRNYWVVFFVNMSSSRAIHFEIYRMEFLDDYF